MASSSPQLHPNAQLTTRPPGPWPRILNATVGAWLCMSAFAWPHTRASQTNSWLVGIAIVITALAGLAIPKARWFNTAFTIWLAVSTITFLHTGPATIWNNLLVALLAFIFSLVPSRGESAEITRPRRR
jgi:hypothetical protein